MSAILQLLNLPEESRTCPIDDLPDELLSYIFQLGVEMEHEGWDEESESADAEVEWVDDDEDSDEISDDEAGDGGLSVNGSDLSLKRVLSVVDPFPEVYERHIVILPFQVLVSHVCRRWRSVALDNHRFWTTLTFCRHPRLAQAKEYISRSSGLPLTIELDCSTDDDDDDEDDEDLDDISDFTEDAKDALSLEELEQVLDLLEPVVSHWGKFVFHASRYNSVHALLCRLHQFPAAPCLESFQVHINDSWDESIFIPLENKIPYLPFHGQAPNLREVVFWGIHIDWEGALANFLRGLRDLELSYLTMDVRPKYSTFAEIIRNSPELRTLTLSLAGPVLADGVAFDSDEGWGSTPLSIPSLTELVLQFHDPKYAAALVQHLDLPNLTHLCLNFDEEDYSGFVQTLARPLNGRSQSFLRKVTHLKISGLPCDIASVEILMSQLTSLKSLNLKLFGAEEETIYEKLVNPWAYRIGPASSSTTSSPPVDIPKVFCPKLEEILTTGLSIKEMKALILARRDAGAPLKRIHIAISEDYDVPGTDDELWIKDNVEELYFFDPSDSEEEYESDMFSTLD